jgi:hypothetical protein
MRVTNDSIISNSVDLSTSWVSDPIWLGHMRDFSIQLFFNGLPNGVLRLQCSNDRENIPDTNSGVNNWSLVQGSTQAIAAAGDHTWAVSDAGYRWVRVQWIPGMSSEGAIYNGRINGKGW